MMAFTQRQAIWFTVLAGVSTPTEEAIEGKLKKTLKLQSPKKRRQPRSEDSKPKCLFCGKEEKDQKGGRKISSD